MPDEPTAADPLKAAAEEEVEAVEAVALGKIPKRPTAAENAAAEAEIDQAAGVTREASLGDADPAAETMREEPKASIGAADPAAETMRRAPAAPPPSMALIPAEDRSWAVGAHLSAVATVIVPFGNVFGPLAVWLMKKQNSPWVAKHALAALNFQITMTLAFVAAALSTFAIVGFVLMPAVIIADIVYTLKATMAASDDQEPTYPDWSLKLVKP
jgi:uncharacterized Tic20 family protein